MCGIAGWIDFTADLLAERDTVAAMTGALRNRGPDAGGHWFGTYAAIGHRRLAVVDIEGGTQPMTATGSERGEPIVLTYSGEVYNFRELRTELMAHGHRFATRSDTEVVLRAYLEWGVACVDRLHGMYALGIWDARREELILIRDRLGIKPLYYYTYPGGILFGSEPKAILANPRFRARMPESALPILFNPRLAMPGETPLTGLRQVKPGHLVRMDRTGTHETPYWRLVSRAHTDDWKTTVRTVRELLEDIIVHQTVADVPLCVLLSGGLDSSAIAALAADRPGRLKSFSVDFANGEADFRATPLRPERDTPYALAAARHIGTEHEQVVLDAAEFPPAIKAALAARDLPSLGQFDASMYLLFEQVRRSATVALSGEAADEVFGGYPWFFDQSTVWSNTFPWLGGGPRLTDVLAPDVRARIRPDEDERDRYATLLAQVPRLAGESGLQARMREVLYLSLQGPLSYLLDRKDRMSMAVGLEVRVPYCDHRLLEYVWNVPWDMKVGDGREKGLLRAAVADLLPDAVLARRKSAYPATFAPAYSREVHDALSAFLDDRTSPLSGLLDADRVPALATRPGALMTVADTAHLLLPLVEVDRWLRTYDVSVTR